MTERWANTKARCLARDSDSTGLYKHHKEGCSVANPALGNVWISLLEQYNTSSETLKKAKHKPGPACGCTECDKLKQLESKWILRLGSIHGQFGLNIKVNSVTKSEPATKTESKDEPSTELEKLEKYQW